MQISFVKQESKTSNHSLYITPMQQSTMVASAPASCQAVSKLAGVGLGHCGSITLWAHTRPARVQRQPWRG